MKIQIDYSKPFIVPCGKCKVPTDINTVPCELGMLKRTINALMEIEHRWYCPECGTYNATARLVDEISINQKYEKYLKEKGEDSKCPDCGGEAKEQWDNGLKVGDYCDDCFRKMVRKCRQRSW